MFVQLQDGKLMGLVRRHDGRLLPVLAIEERDDRLYLHIEGGMVDFWATPTELIARGYRLLCAKRVLWDLWSPVLTAGQSRAPTQWDYLC
jgi:hypothetical protein